MSRNDKTNNDPYRDLSTRIDDSVISKGISDLSYDFVVKCSMGPTIWATLATPVSPNGSDEA
jgi:hypothetical protein